MPFLTLDNLSDTYKNSNYYRLMCEISTQNLQFSTSDDDEFFVPDHYYDVDLNVTNFEKFEKVIEITKFWRFDEIPNKIAEYIYKNNEKIIHFNTHALKTNCEKFRDLIIKILNNDLMDININTFKPMIDVIVYWNLFEEKIYRFHDFCFKYQNECFKTKTKYLKDFFETYVIQNPNSSNLLQEYVHNLESTQPFILNYYQPYEDYRNLNFRFAFLVKNISGVYEFCKPISIQFSQKNFVIILRLSLL